MSIVSSFLVAAGLSMDNLAVTVSAGCTHGCRGTFPMIGRISLLFALAHFVMFTIGFEGGVLMHMSRSVGPWVACIILICIGVRMIRNAFGPEEKLQSTIFTSFKTQLALSVATIIDALLVGAGMALAAAPFWQTQAALVLCVFATSLCGFYLGSYLGTKFGRNVEIVGGCVLVFLGVKVLLEGTGIW